MTKRINKREMIAAAELGEKISLLCDNQPKRVVMHALMALLAEFLHGEIKTPQDVTLVSFGVGFEMAQAINAVIEQTAKDKAP